MIDDIRWVLNEDGTRTLQAYDGHRWFDVQEVICKDAS